MIEIDRIGFAIGKSQILNEVSALLPRGKMTAIIGPNGAGKSTLLSLIARLISPASGTIRVDGHDVQQTASDTLARILAVLRQENVIASRLRVRELVGFGRFPHTRGQPDAQDGEKIQWALDLMALSPFADRFLDQLSGGQRQRALIAMILCQDTDYILLDEPLNNLDLFHSRKLMQVLQDMAHRLGKTPVLVIHDINYAAKYADNILAMKQGGVFANGPTQAIFENDLLSDLFDTPIRIHQIDGQPVAMHH